MPEQECRQVVLVPFPLQGHLNPMLKLGNLLHSEGFSIVVAHTMFNAPNPLNFPCFKFIPILDTLLETDPSPGNLINFIKNLNSQCEAPMRDCLTRIMERNYSEGRGYKLVCVIYDQITYFSEAVASQMKLPSIVLRTSSAATTVGYDIIPQLHMQGHMPLLETMLEDPVPEFPNLRYKDLSLDEIGNMDEVLEIIDIVDYVGNSSAIIWNTIAFLEKASLSQLQEASQIPIFHIGPLNKIAPTSSSSSLLNEDGSCISWLDKQAPGSVIYISLGSLASLDDEKKLAEMAWGLANSGQPFLWVIRPGSVCNSEWIELLPDGFKETVGERGRIVKWAPQKAVLAHGAVGGFWSHCGWNSTLESVSEGVPMICMPCFGDQKVNARHISHVWRVGVHLEHEVSRGRIEEAIKTLMCHNEGKEMRRNALAIKEKIALCIEEGGSSYNCVKALVALLLSF